jgi:hypothetical protein
MNRGLRPQRAHFDDLLIYTVKLLKDVKECATGITTVFAT